MLLGNSLVAPTGEAEAAPKRPPNVVIILADDLGWGDLGSYGHPTISTPNIDRLALEGQRWTSFYAAAPYCTPSRAGLLTGRLPVRSGMASEARTVLFPDSLGGLPASEVTIAELLKTRGYATAMIGKWHLGHRDEFAPGRQGFDTQFWIPYSNDMDATAPREIRIKHPKREYFNVPLLRGGTVVERPVDQATLSRRYSDEAAQFIRAHRQQPFFLYLAHHLPHVPLLIETSSVGRSSRGPYGDAVEEIDSVVGRILQALRENDLDRSTLVMFTSDNGPWLRQRELGGSAGPLREGKGTTFEGGMRVPAIFWWPGTIAPRVVRELGAFFDVLPTLAALAGAPLPKDRLQDGYDLGPALFADGPSPRTSYFYYRNSLLQAVRSGRFKLHLAIRADGQDVKPTVLDAPWLFDLEQDPGEAYDLAAEKPDVVVALRKLASDHLRSVEPAEDQVAKRQFPPP